MKSKKLLSAILALVMVFSLFPVSAFAAGNGTNGLGGKPLNPRPMDQYPAQTLVSDEIDGLTVTVDAPKGALPLDVEMNVTRIANLAAVQAAVDALEDVEGTALVAADITFVSGGKEIQPKKDVTVTMASAELEGRDDLSVVHLDASAQELEDGENAEAEPIRGAQIDEVNGITFEASKFSTFTVIWGGGSVTIHHGIMRNGAFVEFGTNGLPSTSNTNYPTSLNANNYSNYDYAYLIYDFAGYRYVQTRITSSATSNPTTGTSIWPVLQRRTSGTAWRYCLSTSNSWSRDGNVGNNQHIYLIYEEKTITSGYVDPGGDEPGQPPTPPAFTPDVGKNVTDMQPDGTYDITLGFMGNKDTSEVKTTARVIVVFDLSTSMNENMSGGTATATDPSRLRLAKDAVEALAEELLALEDKSGNKLVEMGLVTFATNASIETFGTNVQFTSNYNTGNGADRFYQKVENLTLPGLAANAAIQGGTNWEAALDLANSMPVSGTGKTYIVFVSDGDPTFRTSRGSYSDSVIQDEIRMDLAKTPIFGYGNGSTTITRCYNTAREIAKSIVDHNKTLYTVGLSDNATNMTNLASYAGGIYKAGDDAEQFAAALADIAGAISSEVGLTDVQITDGVTDMSHIETQSLIGTAGNFTYNKSYPLTPADNGYTYKIGETTYTVNQDQVNGGTDGTHRIYTRRNSNGIDIIYIEYPWEGAPEATINTDNSVVWNTASANSELEHGVYYSVTFTVWPKQEAYDLIADLDNGVRKVSDADMTDDVRAQLRVLLDGTTYEYDKTSHTWNPGGLTNAQLQSRIESADSVAYSMKTNTGLSATYKYGGQPNTSSYTNYVNGDMSLDATTIGIHKEWSNLMPGDDRYARALTGEGGYIVDHDGNFILDGEGNKIGYWEYDKAEANGAIYYIDLLVTRNGDTYLENVRLYSDSTPAWTLDEVFISCGVISETDGNLTVREAGYEYTVAEQPSDAYYWELHSDVYHPMVINGITTMLIEVEEDAIADLPEAIQSMENNKKATADGNTYYKFPANEDDADGTLFVVGTSPAMLEAENSRRSVLDLTKIIAEEGQQNDGFDPDALFAYDVTLNNDDLLHPGDTGYDGENTDGFWFSVYDPVADSTVMDEDIVTGAVRELNGDNEPTGYWWFDNGATVTIKIKAGWNVRFTNLLSGTTYEITESAMDDGFAYQSVEGTAVLNGATQEYETTIDDDTFTIEGEIEEPNTTYTVTYTNKYEGFFYVYHSADNTVERFPIAEDGVKVTSFDITALTADGTLYGGYYKDYAGKSADFAAKDLTYTDGKSADEGEDVVPYTGAEADSWVYSNAYDTSGLTMAPAANTTYYLKEVPDAKYLRPYLHYTYKVGWSNEMGGTDVICTAWLISDVDDLNYQETGFVIIDADKGAENVVKSLKVETTNGGNSVTLNAQRLFKAYTNNYLSYLTVINRAKTDGSTYNGNPVVELLKENDEVLQYWVTPDGLKVTGTAKRTYTGLTDKGSLDKTETAVSSTISVFSGN